MGKRISNPLINMRYDFIEVNQTQPNGKPGVSIAQVLMFFHLTDSYRYAVVKFLVKDTEYKTLPELSTKINTTTCIKPSFDIYKWNNKEIEIIPYDSINRRAAVIPVFKKNEDDTPEHHNPRDGDRFYYLNIKFFDRDGWLNNQEQDLIVPPETNTPVVVLPEALNEDFNNALLAFDIDLNDLGMNEGAASYNVWDEAVHAP